jgi:hypothetical protein
VTEDDLVKALAAGIDSDGHPAPAMPNAITETEAACGYSLPPLLKRLLMEIANGGFGPSSGLYGVCGHEGYSADTFPDMTEAALEFLRDPVWERRRWCLPLIDWGCAIMTMIDCRDPRGPLWGWDPNLCCLDHALFPLDQNLFEFLEASLVVDFPEPFYSGYSADLKTVNFECAPLSWKNGRLRQPTQTP